jgi:hypothetical protein
MDNEPQDLKLYYITQALDEIQSAIEDYAECANFYGLALSHF